jgi:hypothetical protein
MNFLCYLLVTILINQLKKWWDTKKEVESLMRRADVHAKQYDMFFDYVNFRYYAIGQAVEVNKIWKKVYIDKKFSKRQRQEMRGHILELAKKYVCLERYICII